MSQILSEHRSPYPVSANHIKSTTARNQSGSQVILEKTERILPLHNRPLNAPKTDQQINSVRQSYDGPSSSKAHRRTTSLALNPANHSKHNSISWERKPYNPSAAIMADVPLDAPPTGRLRTFYDKNRGLAYVLLAQIFGCLMNVTTRLLEIEGNHGQGMHPFQILFVRMAITTTLSTIYMWWSEIPYFPLGMPEVRWLLLLRGIGGFFGVFGMYYSLLFLPLADATVITFISPSISCFACSIFIKEPFTRMEQMGALVSFVGVTLIARPTTFFHHGAVDAPPEDAEASHSHSDYNRVTSSQRFSAVCVALVGVLGQAMAFTTMRWMGKRAHPLLSVNYFCAMCTLVSAVAMAALPGVPFLLPADLKEWGYLIFLGICGFVMQFLLSAGLQIEKSSRATNMVYTQMLFALIFDKLVFGTDPSLLSVVGSSLILGSALYVAMAKENLKSRLEAEKATRDHQMEAGAGSGGQGQGLGLGNVLEMQSRHGSQRNSLQKPDEERGLVAGMDEDDEAHGHLNGNGVLNGKMKIAPD